MELADLLHRGADEREPGIRLLVADDDQPARSRLVSCARETRDEILVLEAVNGTEAIQLGLERRPEIAVVDVDLPRLGGIEAAMTLRELQPRLRVALQAADPVRHRARADANRLPLFGKFELDRTLAWLRAQIRFYEVGSARQEPERLNLRCTRCGFGAVRSSAPERCPMCQAVNAWIHAPSRSSVAAVPSTAP